MKLRTTTQSEEKYVSPGVVVAPGGWCTCTCTCCWCHISTPGTFAQDDEEL